MVCIDQKQWQPIGSRNPWQQGSDGEHDGEGGGEMESGELAGNVHLGRDV